jgi:hypothetical protein
MVIYNVFMITLFVYLIYVYFHVYCKKTRIDALVAAIAVVTAGAFLSYPDIYFKLWSYLTFKLFG